MIARITPAVSLSAPKISPVNRPVHRVPHEGDQDEEPPEPVDDGRDGGEHLDEARKRVPEPTGGEFGHEHRDPETDRDPEGHPDRGRHEGPLDKGKGAVLGRDRVRVPEATDHEPRPERREREPRQVDQEDDEDSEGGDDPETEEGRDGPEDRIPPPTEPSERARSGWSALRPGADRLRCAVHPSLNVSKLRLRRR
jgi:hypothetical protein